MKKEVSSGPPKKLLNPLHRDEWYVFNLFGKPAYADAGLCLVGKPPSRVLLEGFSANHTRLEKAIALRTAPMTAKKLDDRYVYFDGLDLPIDTRYYEHVLAEYPDASFHLPKQGKATNPITIKSGDQIVGAVMCMNVYSVESDV